MGLNLIQKFKKTAEIVILSIFTSRNTDKQIHQNKLRPTKPKIEKSFENKIWKNFNEKIEIEKPKPKNPKTLKPQKLLNPRIA